MPDYYCDFCRAPAEVADRALHLDAADPSALEQVLTMLPFAAVCGSCGSPLLIPRAALYTDRRRGFAVRLRPSGFRMPLYAGPLDGVLRDTQLLLEFREKVLLLSRGLNDLAIELLKVRTIEANAETETPLADIVCTDTAPGHLEMRGITRTGDMISYCAPIELYEAARSAVPDSWQPHGFATVDMAWMRERLRRAAARSQEPK